MIPLCRLDQEAIQTCHRLAGLLLKTFCLPSISGLLSHTGEFEQRPRKRYDDFLYVLSGFVTEPIHWLERYGWRPLLPQEQQALFLFWRHVGARMGITGLPATLTELLRPAPERARSAVANLKQRLSPSRRTRFYSEATTPSDGRSFQLEQLGPPPLLERLNSPRWSGGQRRIGLTGGIASGKSSVGRLLAAQRLPVLDADLFAREALAPGSPGSLTVLERYGNQVASAAEKGSVDRVALGRIVFADATERRWLEQLIHPIVRERFSGALNRLADAEAVVLMIPLLFEAGLEELCSEVWLVECDPAQQLQRLIRRDGLSEAEANARIAAQWPLARKRQLADVVIDNRDGPEHLAAQVEAALSRASSWPCSSEPCKEDGGC